MKDVQAERAVIGALLLTQGKCADACVGLLDSEAFTEPGLGIIYDTVLELVGRGVPADLVMVVEELTTQGNLARVGGTEAVANLLEGVVSASNVAYHVDLVRKAWVKRRALRELKRLEHILDEGEDPYDQILSTNHALELVVNGTTHSHETDALLQETFTDIESDIRWGFTLVDRLSDRVRRREVSVVGGRPSNGKTSFLAAVACNMLDDGKRVLIVSKEMPRSRLLQKIVANRFGLRVKDMTSGERALYYGKMKDMLENNWDGRLTIIDDVSSAFKVPYAIRQHKPDVVMDDYIQFGLYGEKVRLDVTRAMNMYKTMAREKNIAVVVAAQLNRESVKREDPRPRPDDLKESGGIEEFADVILLLHYPSRIAPLIYGPEDYEVIVGKARYGDTGVVPFRFNGKLARFAELDEPIESLMPQLELDLEPSANSDTATVSA